MPNNREESLLCPNCGSESVVPVDGKESSYRCPYCGYVLEIEEDSPSDAIKCDIFLYAKDYYQRDPDEEGLSPEAEGLVRKSEILYDWLGSDPELQKLGLVVFHAKKCGLSPEGPSFPIVYEHSLNASSLMFFFVPKEGGDYADRWGELARASFLEKDGPCFLKEGKAFVYLLEGDFIPNGIARCLRWRNPFEDEKFAKTLRDFILLFFERKGK